MFKTTIFYEGTFLETFFESPSVKHAECNFVLWNGKSWIDQDKKGFPKRKDRNFGKDLRSAIGFLFSSTDVASVLIIRKGQALPSSLLEVFFSILGMNKNYAFACGSEIMNDYSIELITREFFKEWVQQAIPFLPNGLCNGGIRYRGNENRIWISNDIRREEFNKKEFAKIPIAYSLDSTRRCNLRCTKCPYHRQGANGRIGWRNKALDMPIDLIRRIADECDKRTTVYISISGETLLHPGFEDILKELYKRELRFSYTSNATLLSDSVLLKMLDHGLESLVISLDAVTEETYKKIVPRTDFNKTISNVENAIKRINEFGRHISLAYVSIPGVNENEFEDYINQWLNRVNSISQLIWADPATETQTTCFDIDLPKRFACIQPYQMQVISPEGLVSPCCRDYDSEMVMGDLKEDKLTEIWNGDNLRKFRNSMLYEEDSTSMHPTCRKCNMWSTGGGYYVIDGNHAIYTERHHRTFTNNTNSIYAKSRSEKLIDIIRKAGFSIYSDIFRNSNVKLLKNKIRKVLK